MPNLRDKEHEASFKRMPDGTIKVRDVKDINLFTLRKFEESHPIEHVEGGRVALSQIKEVVKYFIDRDSDGYYNLNAAFAFALDQPLLMKSFYMTGLSKLEPVSYAYGVKGDNTYFGVSVPPKFYVSSARPYSMQEITGLDDLAPVGVDVWEKEKNRVDPEMCQVIESFYSDMLEKFEKPRIFFDMDGTLVRWENDWSMGPFGVKAWKQPGFFESCAPHRAMVSLCNALVEDERYQVFVLTATNKVPHAVDEKIRWCKKYIPGLYSDHVLCVEDGVMKGAAIRPDTKTMVFDDYHKSLQGIKNAYTKESGEAVLVQVINNLTIPSDPVVSPITCSTDRGLKISDIDRLLKVDNSFGGGGYGSL